MLWFIGLAIFLFVAYSAVTFERKPLTKTSENYAIDEAASNPYVIKDVVQDTTRIPIIDPSICPDNPEGYIYFQIGDEVFRYTKYSPIKISSINPMSELRRNTQSVINIPEGCKENPYVGVIISYSYSQSDEDYKKINISKFVLLPTKGVKKISHGQKSYQLSYQDYLDGNSKCFGFMDGVDKCVWDNKEATRKEIYKTRHYKIMNNPYILECINFVRDVECSTFYRIYQSLDFNYSFYLNENKNWAEQDILKFDQYLRSLFENMRVTNKVNKGDGL